MTGRLWEGTALAAALIVWTAAAVAQNAVAPPPAGQALRGAVTPVETGAAVAVFTFETGPDDALVGVDAPDFDAVLTLVSADGSRILRNDDHGGVGEAVGLDRRDPAITIPPGSARRWVAFVTPFSGPGGSFTVRLLGASDAALVTPPEGGAGALAQVASILARRLAGGTGEMSANVAMVADAIDSGQIAMITAGHTASPEAAMELTMEMTGGPPVEFTQMAEAMASLDADLDAVAVEPQTPLPDLYPWPPPSPSAQAVLDPAFYGDRLPDSLGDAGEALHGALSDAGFPRAVFLGAPGGFALVSQLEQTDAEGAPLAGPARFAARIRSFKRFDPLDYLRALVTAEPGYFRTLVIVVTDVEFAPREEKMPLRLVQNWAREGQMRLPPDIAAAPHNDAHAAYALVYEFRKQSKDENPFMVPDSVIAIRAHYAHTALADHL